MSALAVFFERQGIATVVFGLVLPHLEQVKPPRALFVPFELGRPLGGPGIPEFRNAVLDAGLALLDRSDGPLILEEYALDDPGAAEDASWSAPDLSSASSVQEEVEMLSDAQRANTKRYGQSQVGLSGLSIQDAVGYLTGFGTSTPVANPDDSMSDLLRMRFSADDMRSFFIEAANANGDPNTVQVANWFMQTHAAKELLRIRSENSEHENATRALVCGKLLVPGAWLPS